MIILKNITLRRSAKVLLDSVSATINPGEHVGLIGRNGAGKSSLFALLNGSLHEDGGDFQVPAHWRMAQVAQNMPETEESASDFVAAGDTRLAEAQARLALAEALLARGRAEAAEATLRGVIAAAEDAQRLGSWRYLPEAYALLDRVLRAQGRGDEATWAGRTDSRRG